MNLQAFQQKKFKHKFFAKWLEKTALNEQLDTLDRQIENRVRYRVIQKAFMMLRAGVKAQIVER